MAITTIILNKEQIELISRKLAVKPDEAAILCLIPAGARITKFPTSMEMLASGTAVIEYETKDNPPTTITISEGELIPAITPDWTEIPGLVIEGGTEELTFSFDGGFPSGMTFDEARITGYPLGDEPAEDE